MGKEVVTAEGLMSKAEKKLMPSLRAMRMKPDWEEARPLFEEAALKFKLEGSDERAILAYEKAAEANYRGGGTLWHAAKHLEEAGALSAKLLKWDAAIDFYERASNDFVKGGVASNGAECLGRGARVIEAVHPEKAAQLYRAALDIYAEDKKAGMAEELVQCAVASLLRAQQWGEAAEFLIKWGGVCDRYKLTVMLCRAYLGDAQAAWQSYQDLLDVPAFSESTEAMAIEALFAAFAASDSTLIVKKAAHSDFKQLDASVARLAKQLPSKTCDLFKMASYLAEKMEIAPPVVDADGFLEDSDGDVDLT